MDTKTLTTQTTLLTKAEYGALRDALEHYYGDSLGLTDSINVDGPWTDINGIFRYNNKQDFNKKIFNKLKIPAQEINKTLANSLYLELTKGEIDAPETIEFNEAEGSSVSATTLDKERQETLNEAAERTIEEKRKLNNEKIRQVRESIEQQKTQAEFNKQNQTINQEAEIIEKDSSADALFRKTGKKVIVGQETPTSETFTTTPLPTYSETTTQLPKSLSTTATTPEANRMSIDNKSFLPPKEEKNRTDDTKREIEKIRQAVEKKQETNGNKSNTQTLPNEEVYTTPVYVSTPKIQQDNTDETKTKEVKRAVEAKKSKPEFQYVIAKKQEEIKLAQELKASLENNDAKIWVKVTSPEQNLSVKVLQEKATQNPQGFVNEVVSVHESNGLTKGDASMVALKNYEILTDNTNPDIQTALVIANSPVALSGAGINQTNQQAVIKVASKKLTQSQLYKQYFKNANINTPDIEISTTPKDGFTEVVVGSVITDQIINPHIESLQSEIAVLSGQQSPTEIVGERVGSLSLNSLSNVSDSPQITESLLQQAGFIPDSEGVVLISNTLSPISITETSATEFTQTQQSIQNQTFGKTFQEATQTIEDNNFPSITNSIKQSVKRAFKGLVSKISISLKKMEGNQGAMVVGGGLVAFAGVASSAPILTYLGGITSFVGLAINPANIFSGAAFTSILAPIVGFFGSLLNIVITSIVAPIIIGVLCVPLLVGLFLFIINSGAYVVPLGNPDTPFVSIGDGGIPVVCTDEKGPVFSTERDPKEPHSTSDIANRAWKITFDLYQGFWCYWNRSPSNNPWNGPPRPDFPKDWVKYPQNYPNMFDYDAYKTNPNPAGRNDVANLFWCTWLVIKAYNENGNKIAANTYTPSMYSDFLSRNKIIDAKDATSDNILPGSVVFFYVTTGPDRLNHVGVVYSVDRAGIEMVQSNAPTKSFRIPFAEGGKGIPDLDPMLVMHFGLP